MKHLIDMIDAFDEQCAAEEYTDTGDAWDLLRHIRAELEKIRPTGRAAVTITRKAGEKILARLPTGNDMEIFVSSYDRGRVRITVVADKTIKIVRT